MTQLEGADYKSSIQQPSNLDMTLHEIILRIVRGSLSGRGRARMHAVVTIHGLLVAFITRSTMQECRICASCCMKHGHRDRVAKVMD